MKIILRTSILLFAVVVVGLHTAQAQVGKQTRIAFNMPLRPNVLFAYKVTERVRAKHTKDQQLRDSSDRVTTYYITSRQSPVVDTAGLLRVEVNVDSMSIDFRSINDRIAFNTQKRPSLETIRHREVFAASVLTNRPVTFTMNAYGEVLRIESEGLDQVRKQAQDSTIPLTAYSRARLLEATDNMRLLSLLLPGRGLLPIGRKVNFGAKMGSSTVATLDMIPIRDSIRSQLFSADQNVVANQKRPHLHFESIGGSASAPRATFSCFDVPVNITSARSRMFGDLFLDEDGVVYSGLISISGSVGTSTVDGPYQSDIVEEVYIDRMSTSQSPVVESAPAMGKSH